MKILLLFVLIILSMATSTTERYVFHLEDHVDPQTFALEHNLKFIKRVFQYSIFEGSASSFHSLHANAAVMEHVLFSEKQVAKQRFTRANFNLGRVVDPLYASQWHLHPPGDYSVKRNEISATIDGTGINLAIVDDGLQNTHPDLQANFVADHSYDYNLHRNGCLPRNGNSHGTAAAGVAGAVANNGHCGHGVAPKVSLIGVRLIGAPVYDYVEAQGITHALNIVDIYSCSWGPADGGQNLEGPGQVTQTALEHGTKVGRNGKGAIYIWAGGNGGQYSDNVNYDGYANNRHTIAIGAIDYTGERAYYSEEGACLFAVTPSSGAGRGIITSDLLGHDGYSAGECTNTFGGTSSAAPLAAGIVALILQQHPQFTWRDVQHVLAQGATQIDPQNNDWTSNTIPHSHLYGFGLLVIPDVLRAARHHHLVPAQKHLQSLKTTVNVALNGFFHNVQIRIPGSLTFVETVEVIIDVTHNRHGAVVIDLVSPSNVTSKLSKLHSDTHTGKFQWKYTSVRHWGEAHPNNVEWMVRIKDGNGQSNQGRWNSVQIILYGY